MYHPEKGMAGKRVQVEETETQRGEAISPRSHSKSRSEPGLELSVYLKALRLLGPVSYPSSHSLSHLSSRGWSWQFLGIRRCHSLPKVAEPL